MMDVDARNGPAHYVAQNLLSEVERHSDMTYEVEPGDGNTATGAHSLEARNGVVGLATIEGYRQESSVRIEELDVGRIDVWVQVLKSPTDRFPSRVLDVAVERPSEYRQGDAEHMQELIYNQLHDDVNDLLGMEAEQVEDLDRLILSYSWE